ncbi:MAG: phage terminase large subunit [Fimbriimonadaceae bacterium]|nr:phage terminase large subunit [Fimbriimonadaceae bacterium]
MLDSALLSLQKGLAELAATDGADPELEAGRASFAEFVRQAWPLVSPDIDLEWWWHLDAMADHLQAVYEGSIRDLLINIPPGMNKSLFGVVLWPAWIWARSPEWGILTASYAQDLALRDAVRTRDVVESDWYRSSYGRDWSLKGDQNTKGYYRTTQGGERLALSVGSKGTGFRGNVLILDDGHNIGDGRHTPEALKGVVDWFQKAMSTRFRDMRQKRRVVIGQRVAEGDIGDACKAAGYECLILPMRQDLRISVPTSLGWKDPREEGELLFPGMFPAQVVADMERDLGPEQAAAQLQQDPAPAGGLMFLAQWRRHWVRPWETAAPEVVTAVDAKSGEVSKIQVPILVLPTDFELVILSVDATFKAAKDSDYVVIQVWGWAEGRAWLLDQVRERLSFTATVQAIREVLSAHPAAAAVLVEDAANGPAIIDTLQREIPIMVPVSAHGAAKEGRAAATTGAWQAGSVATPHPGLTPWAAGFEAELAGFPKAKHDDQVDAMGQAIRWFLLHASFGYSSAVGGRRRG